MRKTKWNQPCSLSRVFLLCLKMDLCWVVSCSRNGQFTVAYAARVVHHQEQPKWKKQGAWYVQFL